MELRAEDPAMIGPYRVLARLGSGGMGTVSLCESRGGRRFAVKAIRPGLRDDAQFRKRYGETGSGSDSLVRTVAGRASCLLFPPPLRRRRDLLRIRR